MKKVLISMGVVATSFCIALPISAAQHEVKLGDTLWSIASEHNTSVADIKELNQLDTHIIQPNQILQIDKEVVHVVKKGETLSEIAKEYGVSVKQLKKWNELKSDIILIGDKLTIEEPNKKEAVSTQPQEQPVEEKQQEEPQQPEPVEEPQEKPQPEPVEQPKQEQPKEEAPVQEQSAPAQGPAAETSSSDQSGETISVSATAYTADCEGCTGVTATGIDLKSDRDKKVIAVDPSVIPLGSKVYVEGYGEAIAGDTGGAIKGNKIDVHVPTKDEAFGWGVRSVDVTILD
ncbi:LysM peptidoglycan-binding domain-containing protein [Gracilibacillus alcaliphilus]|uniref:LysM peptidoglycan-binding domain-containing protein n=1 Tax=Gracilibacillus alcaliphilus TaxID=1401441 RepID=UPI0019598556|nr:LysM peptidoglycan-binding domain-containing protein [Gracilibacillus alcaliphilus]MBM7679162.1 3D (Asp-Asp-Asp) domain-containing protein/LysM repeat protein [Gracilibacillus alcaliphilus]